MSEYRWERITPRGGNDGSGYDGEEDELDKNSIRRVYGYGGEQYPRFTITVYLPNSLLHPTHPGFNFSTDYKRSDEDWWEAGTSGVPHYLMDDLLELIAEARALYGRITSSRTAGRSEPAP